MSNSGSGSGMDKLVRSCLRLLLAAGALYMAVQLFLSVVGVVLIIGGIVGLAGVAVALWRRHRGW
jgi:hypothetical protein